MLVAFENFQQIVLHYFFLQNSPMIHFSFQPYTLRLQHVFTVAAASRSSTPLVLTQLTWEGVTGYGEASMPPYLGESHATATDFLSKVDLSAFTDPFQMESILQYLDTLASGNHAAKASVDIALHDLVGKLLGQPWYRIWGFDRAQTPFSSFTISIDAPEVVRQKVQEATDFRILKVKLGLDNDREMIETIRSVTDKPLVADANQGWKDRNHALEMLHWLHERGVTLIEQPMPKERLDDHAWLTERSPIPLIADEAVQRLPDVLRAQGAYHGINIKLMKSTGLREAQQMLLLAQALGMKVMLGCMTETSCAISAAAQLAPAANWADLDGALLIQNDPFRGAALSDGKIIATDLPGIGCVMAES